MKKLTVAFFFHDTDYYSGGTRSLIDLLEGYLKSNAIEIIAVFPTDKGSAVEYVSSLNIRYVTSHYYQIRKNLCEDHFESFKNFPKRVFQLVKSYLWVKAVTVNKLKKYKIDIVYSNTSFILAGYWCSTSLHIPLVAHFREFGEEDHKITTWFSRKRFYKIASNYDRIICISNSLKNKYIKYLPQELIRVLYDDVSTSYINWSPKDKSVDNQINILIAGNITPGKGQLRVIELLKSFLVSNNNVHIYIAGGRGDETYAKQIDDFLKRNKLENVHCLGLVKDMNKLRNKMNIGIVSSEMEAFGRVTIEGMLSGLIMVVTDSACNLELIKDHETGFIIAKDMNNLEAVIKEICNNWSNLKNLQRNAFSFALRFTEGNCGKKLLREFEELVHE